MTPFRYTRWYAEAELTNSLGRLNLDEGKQIGVVRQSHPIEGNINGVENMEDKSSR